MYTVLFTLVGGDMPSRGDAGWDPVAIYQVGAVAVRKELDWVNSDIDPSPSHEEPCPAMLFHAAAIISSG
jgi:hypothetical protein